MGNAKAKMDLLMLHSKAENFNVADFITELINKGLPNEMVTRLQLLGSQIKYIGEQSINIGKIILMKLWDFIKENPNLAIGFAIGLGLATLVGMLINLIPWIGTWLSGIVTPIIAVITIPIGTLKGHRLDKVAKGEPVSDSILEDLITIAKKFWTLIVDIFTALKEELRD